MIGMNIRVLRKKYKMNQEILAEIRRYDSKS